MNSYIYTLLATVTLALSGAEPHQISVSNAKKSSSYKQLLDLLEGKHPTVAGVKKAKVTPGFGDKFDFITPLRQADGKDDAVYKRRLFALKDILSWLCDPSVLSVEELHNSQHFAKNFQTFAHHWALLEETKSALHADNLILHGYSAIKEHVATEHQTSAGPVFTNLIGQNIMHVTNDDDAVAFLLSLCKLQLRKKSPTLSDITRLGLQLLRSGNVSEQSSKVLKFTLGALVTTSPALTTDIFLQKKVPVHASGAMNRLTEQDSKHLWGILANVPHLKQIQALIAEYHTLALSQPEKLHTIDNKELVLHKGFQQTYRSFYKYLAIAPQLETEYGTLVQRIKQEIKRPYRGSFACAPAKPLAVIPPVTPEPQPAVQSAPEKAVEEQPTQLQSAQPLHAAISSPAATTTVRTPAFRYAPRVMRWFNEGFAKAQTQRSITYHTLLPLSCDADVVTWGEHSKWANNRVKSQKDDHYRLPGKVTFADGSHEYYIFDVCIDPQKTCYHRGCSAVPFNALVEQLNGVPQIEDDAIEGIDTSESEAAVETSRVEYESALSKVIYNPQHKCTITLYKMLT